MPLKFRPPRIYRELRAVGLRDWFWFVVRLGRNEFHPRLSAVMYPRTREGSLRCMRDRDRAHTIDQALRDLGTNGVSA